MRPTDSKFFAEQLASAIERLAQVLAVEVSHGELRASARAAVTAHTSELEIIRQVAESQHLQTRVVSLTVDDLMASSTALPLVAWSSEGWLVLTEQSGLRLCGELAGVSGEPSPRWMELLELRRLLGAERVDFVQVASSMPMSSLSAGAHEVSDLDVKRVWARVWSLARLERDDVLVIATYSAVIGVLSLATPLAVQSLVGTVAFGTLLQPVVILALLFLAALGFQAVLKALKAWVIESLQARFFARVALDVAYRIPRAHDDAGDIQPELAHRFFDVVAVQKTLATLLTDGLSAVMQITVGCLVLAFYHPALLGLDVLLLVATLLLVLIPLRRGVKTALDESSAKYAVAGWIQELARVPSVFRSAAGAALAVDKADELTRGYLAARRRHFSVVFRQTLSALVVHVVTSSLLLGFGGYLVIQESLTLGQLVAAELIVATVTAGITKFGKLLESTYDLVASLTKVGQLVDFELSRRSLEQPTGSGPVSVQVTGVEGSQGTWSLTIEPGERVAIVGGRELAPLLSGERSVLSGTIEIGDVDLRSADRLRLREEVAFVQLGQVFAGTVFENAALGRAGIRKRDVRTALAQVGLLDAVRALPEGEDTPITADGPLTPQQNLLLCIVRALVSNPRLVIVDDVLDLLDPTTRDRVARLLTGDHRWTLIAFTSDGQSALARSCARLIHQQSSPPNRSEVCA